MSTLCDSDFSLTAAAIIIYPICFIAGLLIGFVISFFLYKWKKSHFDSALSNTENADKPIEVKSTKSEAIPLSSNNTNNSDQSLQRKLSSKNVMPRHSSSIPSSPSMNTNQYQNADDVLCKNFGKKKFYFILFLSFNFCLFAFKKTKTNSNC